MQNIAIEDMTTNLWDWENGPQEQIEEWCMYWDSCPVGDGRAEDFREFMEWLSREHPEWLA